MGIHLRALTWDDPRGHGPTRPLADAFARSEAGRGVQVDWDVQPLGGFESASVIAHAHQYDVVIIDHPHIIEAASAGALAPIDLDRDDCYVGPCLASYRWLGRHWAAPVDAACHVSAYREERMSRPPATWSEFFEQARDSTRFGLPLHGVHALMALLTLLASMGSALDSEAGELEQGSEFPCERQLLPALELLCEIHAVSAPESLNWNPLSALSSLAAGACDCLPITFGYAHFQCHGVRFAGIPAVAAELPPRPVLGGTGLAVSAVRAHPEIAVEFARFAASAAVQVDLWPQNGGQPAHADAWRNLAVLDPFYRDTAASLEMAYIRPRSIGWNRFQTDAGNAINHWLAGGGHDKNQIAGRLKALWTAAMSAARPTLGTGDFTRD